MLSPRLGLRAQGSGLGLGAWGMGHGAWGMGHGARLLKVLGLGLHGVFASENFQKLKTGKRGLGVFLIWYN